MEDSRILSVSPVRTMLQSNHTVECIHWPASDLCAHGVLMAVLRDRARDHRCMNSTMAQQPPFLATRDPCVGLRANEVTHMVREALYGSSG